MAFQNLGEAPSRPTDVVDISWVTASYPSYSTYILTHVNYVIVLPDDPVDHQMQLYEIHAGGANPVTITVPSSVLLTKGLVTVSVLPNGKTAFYGFRYSAHVGSWFLLSSAEQD